MVSSLAALFGKVEKHPRIGKRKETNTGQCFPSVLKIKFLGSIQTSDSCLPQDSLGNLYFASYHHECVGTLA